MKDRDIAHFQQLISARIRELMELSDASVGARATVELDQQSVGRLSRMDAIERKAMADATNRLRQREITQLKAALKRIAEGEFGACEDCGDDIETKRLQANPALMRCLDCARG